MPRKKMLNARHLRAFVPDLMIKYLDRAADQQGVSQSHVLRTAISLWMTTQPPLEEKSNGRQIEMELE